MSKPTQALAELTVNELEKRLRDTRADMLGNRLKKKTGQLEKSHLLKEERRTVARILTMLRSKRA
jgi:large subunit ribosomal protein L29